MAEAKRTMKALQLVEIGQPLQMREIPVPALADQDVLIAVRAAGICHTDEHYRMGVSPVAFLPQILGHEVAGVVERAGKRVRNLKPGDRVTVHYLATCTTCEWCRSGHEQFCRSGQMIGKHRFGGYAEYLVMPAASIVPLPEEIPFEHGAIMMCSTATAFHALRKARMRAGERVAVFGAGGLGISAVQLARLMGALEIFAVDIRAEKLRAAQAYGATPVDAARIDPVQRIQEMTAGHGIDVALELVGLPQTMRQAVQSLGHLGRAVMVGLSDQMLEVDVFREVLGKETEIIGCSDHLLAELPLLLEFARQKRLDFSGVVTHRIPLEEIPVNQTLAALRDFTAGVRTVIVP